MTMGRAHAAGTALVVIALFVGGCKGAREKTVVQLHYRLAPAKQLPPGMKTLAVLPAETKDKADSKWSELGSNMVHGLLVQSNDTFNRGLRFTDRADMKKVLDEKDLALSGIADGSMASAAAKVLAADGLVCTRISVNVEAHRGKTRTITLGSLSGLAHGRPNFRTKTVEKVKRNITVQCVFKLLDARTGRAWITHVGDTLNREDVGQPDPFFGSDKTEADLTPTDQVIGQLVERETRLFVRQIMPSEVTVEVELKSDGDETSGKAVKLAAAGEYHAALDLFEQALQESPDSDRSAFGAGLMYERLGQYDQAVAYYKKAILIEPEAKYVVARKRVIEYKDRIWQD